METSTANQIVLDASRRTGTRAAVSLDDSLSSIGIATSKKIEDLIQEVVQIAAQAGYEVNLSGGTSRITKDHKLIQVRDFMLEYPVLDAPKLCTFGHSIEPGAMTCLLGHPAR